MPKEIAMSLSFEEIDSCIDYANTAGLYDSLGSPGSEMLVLVKTGVNFETMVTDYMKWLFASLKKHGTTKIRSWYSKYPKEKYFAATPVMAARMVGLIPHDADAFWKVYYHQESGHLFAQFVSGPTPPKELYFTAFTTHLRQFQQLRTLALI
jgi:hypothetical protein